MYKRPITVDLNRRMEYLHPAWIKAAIEAGHQPTIRAYPRLAGARRARPILIRDC
jgi:hypothetical protein